MKHEVKTNFDIQEIQSEWPNGTKVQHRDETGLVIGYWRREDFGRYTHVVVNKGSLKIDRWPRNSIKRSE